MAEEITCPTCGGLIFSDDMDAMELSPCTCTMSAGTAVQESATVQSAGSAMPSPSRAMPSAVPPARPSGQPVPPESQKLCCNCGKDVTGRKRLKDSQGRYWCPACGKKDEKQKKIRKEQTKTACTMCGTEVAVQNILTYDGQFVCPKCYREKKELEKKTEARIGRINTAFKGQDYKRMMPLLIILGLLALIMLLRTFHIIGTEH